MSWQIAISLSVLANVLTSLIQRHYSQKSSAPASFPPAVSYLFGVTPLGIIVGLSLSHHVHWTWWVGFLLFLNASIMALSNWIGFKAVKRLPVTQNQTIGQFYEVVVVALGWIFLGEGLSKFQFIGALLLLIAALLAIRAPMSVSDRARRKVHIQSVGLTLATAITLGTALVVEKAALGHMDIGAYLIFGYSAQTLAMLVLATKDIRRETLRKFGKDEIKWSAGMGWANAVTGVFYVIAIVRSNNISSVTAVAAITLPLVAFGAYIILKERDNQRLLWLGLAIGLLGLLVSAIR
jgi:drug/metabolite transporter (DMT)-like permease